MSKKKKAKEVKEVKEVKKNLRCPKNNNEFCPYGNEVGTCFAFCLKEAMDHINRKREEPNV